MKTISTMIAVLLLGIGVSGCNTISGMGKDVERGGEKVQNAAEKRGAQQ